MIDLALESSPYSAPTDARWSEIERWTLEACVLRAEGREDDAGRLLKERMPALIRDWSAHCGLARTVVQDRLRWMFAETQTFVARGLAQRRLITSELIARDRGAAAGGIASPKGVFGLRRHVPVSDVVGMLDGLIEAEYEARREAIWPIRSRATVLAAGI